MKTLFLIISFALVHHLYISQNQQDFVGELQKEATKEFPDSQYIQVNLKNFTQLIFKQGKTKMKMDTTSRWQILFMYKFGWRHIVGQKSQEIPFDLRMLNKKPIVKKVYKSSKIYKGTTLYKRLGIKPVYLSNKSKESLSPPSTFINNNHPLNGVWVPTQTSNKNYLALRCVSSYIGSQTSWYSEIIFYFKKVK